MPSSEAGANLRTPPQWTGELMHVSAESHLTGGLGYVSYEVKAYDKKAHGQNQRSSAESVGTPGDL